MAHFKVLDCMLHNNWSMICNLYCAWSSQVSVAAFIRGLPAVSLLRCSFDHIMRSVTFLLRFLSQT